MVIVKLYQIKQSLNVFNTVDQARGPLYHIDNFEEEDIQAPPPQQEQKAEGFFELMGIRRGLSAAAGTKAAVKELCIAYMEGEDASSGVFSLVCPPAPASGQNCRADKA